jgi:hypothetical protein
MRRIRLNFLFLSTQLRPSSCQDVFRNGLVQISFRSAGLASIEGLGLVLVIGCRHLRTVQFTQD